MGCGQDTRAGEASGGVHPGASEDVQARDQAGAQAGGGAGVCGGAEGGVQPRQAEPQEGEEADHQELVLHGLGGVRTELSVDKDTTPNLKQSLESQLETQSRIPSRIGKESLNLSPLPAQQCKCSSDCARYLKLFNLSPVMLYCTVLYCTVLYCTVLYCTVLYCIVLRCTVQYCTVLYRYSVSCNSNLDQNLCLWH